MKKTLFIGILFFVITILWTSVISSVQAQNLRVNPDDIEFDFAGKIVCAIFKNCNSEGSAEEIFPTLQPGEPTPTLLPTPEIMPTTDPTKPKTCSQPLGNYICGSRETPLNNCGHCGVRYPSGEQKKNCDTKDAGQSEPRSETWGTAYAIDIRKSPLEVIILPTIDGQSVTWTQYAERRYATNAIQRYTGIANGINYILQFHHTLAGSGVGINKTAVSGQAGAKLCVTCDHVHVQISKEGKGWSNAADYYCHNQP